MLLVRSQTKARLFSVLARSGCSEPRVRFLDGGGFAQQALGGGIVAGAGGRLRSLNHRRGIEDVGHPIAPAWDPSVRQYNPVGTR